MLTKALNDLTLRKLKAPATGRIELSDGTVPGLKCRITSNGCKSWSIQVNIEGEKRRFTIGEYPAIGIAEARKRAQRLRVEAQQGVDPIKEKRARARERSEDARTVCDTIDEYVTLQLRPNLRTAAERERQLRAALAEHFKLPVSKLTKHDLQAALDRKAQSGAPFAANRVRAALMAFTAWCWRRDYIAENIGIATTQVTKERPRERVLTVAEVQKILGASDLLGPLWEPFVRILIYTAQRRGDVAGMRWSEIDFSQSRWSIPGRRTKNKRPHFVHLSGPVLAELEELQPRALPGCDLVFTTTGMTPISGFGRMKERLDKLSGVEDWRLHDLRTAFASALCDLGEPEGVVDRVLNHAASGSAPSAVARVYNQSEYLPQRARALDKWTEILRV
jgi:integrase